jgi:hypothetical protein
MYGVQSLVEVRGLPAAEQPAADLAADVQEPHPGAPVAIADSVLRAAFDADPFGIGQVCSVLLYVCVFSCLTVYFC